MESLSTIIQERLRVSGHSQKELANELGLNPKVLSRKVNHTGNARLNHQEVKGIIATLARWYAITTRQEALQLLTAAQVEPTVISGDEWQAPPLNALAVESTPSISRNSSSSLASPLHNLPPPATRLIGREWAVTRLRRLLGRADVRLVTLVGAGGSGKTSLALHIARELVGSFTHGVWFVPLAGVRDAAEVPMGIIQALNIPSASDLPPFQSLIAYFRNKQLLLVLDNVEQVTGVTDILDELLAQAPAVKVLVTSRVILHFYGEHSFNVPPLDVPDLQVVLKAADLMSFPAIQLFVERAQAALPDFVLSDEKASAIAQICARVDGLPLAIELAAARVKLLPPAQLLVRLSKARLSLLTGGARNLPDRQQTLRNTITWSYNLLSPDEQAWFRRLGVFTGDWSLEAAEAMMQGVADQSYTSDFSYPLDMLERLVDNSLLVRLSVSDEQAHFMMLETLREYALEQLAAHKEIEWLRDWHACYYLQVAEASVQGLRGPQQLTWLTRLTLERDNFRAAFQWLLQRARDGKRIEASSILNQHPLAGGQELPENSASSAALSAIELCLRLAAAFRPYWEWKGYLTEGRSWLITALELPFEHETERSVLVARARALSEAARLVDLQNNQQGAIELAEASITLCRQLDDARGLASALLHRGWAAHAQGDFDTAKCVYREGLCRLSVEVDPWLYGQLLFHLGDAEGQSFNFEQMHACFERSKELFEQLGDRSAIADLLKDQGGLLMLESKYDEAVSCLLQSLRLCYEFDHKQFIATGIGWLSFAVGLRGKPDAATASIYSAQLGGADEALMDSIGLTPWTKTYALTVVARKLLSEIVGEERWNEAWQQGRSLTFEQTIELAYRLGEGV
jgi:predicted ATPase